MYSPLSKSFDVKSVSLQVSCPGLPGRSSVESAVRLGLCRRPLPEMPRLRCRWIHGTPGVAHNGFPEILCLPESAMQCVPASSIEVTFSYTPPPTTRLVRCIQSFDGSDLQAASVLSMAGPVIPTSRTACCSFSLEGVTCMDRQWNTCTVDSCGGVEGPGAYVILHWGHGVLVKPAVQSRHSLGGRQLRL